MIPPPELLRTGWFPFILNFYWKAVSVFWAVPGLVVTSWFRTPEKNRFEGGDVESQHLFALAWDVEPPHGAEEQTIAAARAAGLIAVREKRHVHLQMFPRGALARAGVRFPS